MTRFHEPPLFCRLYTGRGSLKGIQSRWELESTFQTQFSKPSGILPAFVEAAFSEKNIGSSSGNVSRPIRGQIASWGCMGQKFGKGFGVLESTDHENGQVLETLPRVRPQGIPAESRTLRMPLGYQYRQNGRFRSRESLLAWPIGRLNG